MVDVLSDVLRIVRLTGSIFFTADLSDPYAIASPPSPQMLRYVQKEDGCLALFHILTEGQCWFKTESGTAFRLQKGDVVIFPNGCAHSMCSQPNLHPQPLLKLIAFEQISRWSKVTYGGEGDKTQFICGYLLCDQRFNPLLGAVPDVLILSPQAGGRADELVKNTALRQHVLPVAANSWLDSTLRQLIEEVRDKNIGSATIITRLTELMFVEVLRRYMSNLPAKSNGWLAGVRDPEVGKALACLHAHPEKKWDVEQIAAKVGVSRSAFAQRFCDLIGEPPMRYLTGWRIQLAKNLLLQPDLSLAMVAEKVGYDSDIAFSRAFKRYVGEPPARWRDQALVSV